MAVKYDEEDKPEVQMTSMMDCIFLLLIFFLVSSQLKKIEKEVPVELPQAQATREIKMTPDLIKVTVSAKGDIFVRGNKVGPGGLRSALQAAAKENRDRKVIVDGDIYAPFRAVVQVLDACRQEQLSVSGIHTADGQAATYKP
ncbi:MAG: ExbD/TolR family protein [Kiritimatiellia bacterium]